MIYKYFLLSAEALNFLPRIHLVSLPGQVCLAGDRGSEHTFGSMAAPLQLQSLVTIASTTAILSSGCLAAEFVFQNKDGHMRQMSVVRGKWLRHSRNRSIIHSTREVGGSRVEDETKAGKKEDKQRSQSFCSAINLSSLN